MERRIAQMNWMFSLVVFAAALGSAWITRPAPVAAAPAHAWDAIDTDHDGSVDLAEAKTAASTAFDKLDGDHDGTLDRKELKGRLSAKEFAAADGDHDGTLDKNEYLAVVEKRFNDANRDNDGTLDAKEFNTRAGRAVLQLLK
jgi:Ca2+-binding EF-hand superfamily protein